MAGHRRTKRHQPSGAIALENNCHEVTKVVSSSAEAKKCDAEPARATQNKPGAAQSLREVSIANAEGQRANTRHPRVDIDPSGITQSQREAERG